MPPQPPEPGKSPRFQSSWRTLAEDLLGIDLRSLALFRIGLGLLLILDLMGRARDLEAHYTDFGLMPRQDVLQFFNNPFQICLHLANGMLWFQILLFVLAGACALLLLVGYQTRLATFVSWVLLVSVQARNPLITDGGDQLLRLLVFWGLFLPLGARWSLDAYRSTVEPPKRVLSCGTVGLLLQICFIYWFAFLLKTDPVWRTEGTGIYYSLHISQFTTPFALFLLGYPTLLKFLSWGTMFMEGVGPFFAFFPLWRGPVRTATVHAFIYLHIIAMGTTLELGLFPYVGAVAWLALLPSWFWESYLPRRWSAMQTSSSPLVRPLRRLRDLGITAERDLRARYSLQPRIVPLDCTWRRAIEIVFQGIAAFYLIYILLWNIRTTDFKRFQALLPQSLDGIGEVAHVEQVWNMFAPGPMKEGGWFVIPATLRDGTTVDLFTEGGAITWERPPVVSETFKDSHWRKYYVNLSTGNDSQCLYLARYLTREWDRRHSGDKSLVRFDIYFMRERTPPPSQAATQTMPAAERIYLWHHECNIPSS